MNEYRCAVCGKFIGYEEDVVTDYTPDNVFGPEEIIHMHLGCSGVIQEEEESFNAGLAKVLNESKS